MVPWDTYMPRDAPRYFGTPEQYADLYGFVRAGAAYLDGYEDAAVVGKTIKDDRHGPTPPVALRGGSGDVWAFVRAQPGQPDAPVAVHLIDWGEPKPFAVALRNAAFSGPGQLTARLLVPAKYDRATHDQADKTGDYSSLARAIDVKSHAEEAVTTVEIPRLAPWGILVISPGR